MDRKWKAECMDRNTGEESTKVVAASTKEEAINILAELGQVIGTIAEETTPEPQAVMERHARALEDSLTVADKGFGLVSFGVLLLVAGIIAVGYGATMDTAPTGTHNLGLLMNRIVTVLIGCTTVLASLLLFVIWKLGQKGR